MPITETNVQSRGLPASLSLGTYDCEACTGLQLLADDQSSNSELTAIPSNTTGFFTLE